MIGAVRRAVDRDANGLAACIEQAYARYVDLALPDVANGISQEIDAHMVWVIEAENVIIGGIIVGRDKDQAHLRNIAVHPEHGGQGIASLLIGAAIDAVSVLGVQTVVLATHIGMPENVALYTHLGWVETGREGDKVFMSRDI